MLRLSFLTGLDDRLHIPSPVGTANAIGFNLSEFAETNSDKGYEEVDEEPEESLANDFPDTSIAIQINQPRQVTPASTTPSPLEAGQLALCTQSKVKMESASIISGASSIFENHDDSDEVQGDVDGRWRGRC